MLRPVVRGDEEPMRLLWVDQRLHTDFTKELSSVWHDTHFFSPHLYSSRVPNSRSRFYGYASSTINPPGSPLVWVPVKTS